MANDEGKKSNALPAEMKDAVETQNCGAENETRVFVVGLGQTGRELVHRLRNIVTVVGLDIEKRKIKAAQGRFGEDGPQFLLKDCASKLTWSDIGLRPDDTIVVTARRDEVNLEVCRLAKEHFGVKRLIGMLHSKGMAAKYEAAGIETVSRAKVLATFMASHIIRDRRTALNVGLGQGELMEVPILPGSPVIGRRLSAFHARPWLVGAIYRNEKLIVPHGRTVIREGDRVLIVGEPHILSAIADFFKIGEPEFPLQYGLRIGVLDNGAKGDMYEALVSESDYLANNTKATSMVILSLPQTGEPNLEIAGQICEGTELVCEPAYLSDEEDKPWPKLLQAQDLGCMVTPFNKFGLFRRLGLMSSTIMRVLEEAEYPVLISRGSHPYKAILVPVTAESSPLRVTQLAVDLARLFSSRLDALAVTEPVFSVGHEAVEEQKSVLDHIMEYSDLYRLKINIHHREGNPIKETVEMASDYNLLVIGYSRRKRSFFPRLDITLEIAARAKCSVMVLPFTQE